MLLSNLDTFFFLTSDIQQIFLWRWLGSIQATK